MVVIVVIVGKVGKVRKVGKGREIFIEFCCADSAERKIEGS